MSEISSILKGFNSAGQPCGESAVSARTKRFSRSQLYGFQTAARWGYKKRDTKISILRSSILKAHLFGLIHRRSRPVITRGGESCRLFRIVVVIVLVIAAGMISWTSDVSLFEIDISGYFAAICDTRQHYDSSVDNAVYWAIELFSGQTYFRGTNSKCS